MNERHKHIDVRRSDALRQEPQSAWDFEEIFGSERFEISARTVERDRATDWSQHLRMMAALKELDEAAYKRLDASQKKFNLYPGQYIHAEHSGIVLLRLLSAAKKFDREPFDEMVRIIHSIGEKWESIVDSIRIDYAQYINSEVGITVNDAEALAQIKEVKPELLDSLVADIPLLRHDTEGDRAWEAIALKCIPEHPDDPYARDWLYRAAALKRLDPVRFEKYIRPHMNVKNILFIRESFSDMDSLRTLDGSNPDILAAVAMKELLKDMPTSVEQSIDTLPPQRAY